jgi:hypothetical protein
MMGKVHRSGNFTKHRNVQPGAAPKPVVRVIGPPAAVARSKAKRQNPQSIPTALPIPTGGRVAIRPGQRGAKTGFTFPAVGVDWIDFERVCELIGKHAGATIYLIGAGPSSKGWREHYREGDILIACNSAILQLADVADYFLCTEGNGYELGWFWTETAAIPVVSYCNLKWPDKEPRSEEFARRAIPIERSWHLAGFHPREYFNPARVPEDIWNSYEGNLYAHYGMEMGKVKSSFIGVDRYTAKEWGLLKGPVCYGNMSIGTVCVNGAHLACIMGADRLKSIGFELHMADGCHAAEPKFAYKPSKWSPPECFMKVNGKPTLWHFALSAAYAVSLKPVFRAAGMRWDDYSGGLMDIPGIEKLLSEVHKKPHDVTIAVSKPETKIEPPEQPRKVTEAEATPRRRRKKKEPENAEKAGQVSEEGNGGRPQRKKRVRNLHEQPAESRGAEEGQPEAGKG